MSPACNQEQPTNGEYDLIVPAGIKAYGPTRQALPHSAIIIVLLLLGPPPLIFLRMQQHFHGRVFREHKVIQYNTDCSMAPGSMSLEARLIILPLQCMDFRRIQPMNG